MKATKPSDALEPFVNECPETGEPQGIIVLAGTESGYPALTLITRGETTAWKHTITTVEMDPENLPKQGDGVTPETQVAQTKRWRQQLDAVLQEMKDERRAHALSIAGKGRDALTPESADEQDGRTSAVIRLKESIMHCGLVLKALGTPNPYPQSYDPSSPVVEKTADNLKL